MMNDFLNFKCPITAADMLYHYRKIALRVSRLIKNTAVFGFVSYQYMTTILDNITTVPEILRSI